jgi:hypothetical protein
MTPATTQWTGAHFMHAERPILVAYDGSPKEHTARQG